MKFKLLQNDKDCIIEKTIENRNIPNKEDFYNYQKFINDTKSVVMRNMESAVKTILKYKDKSIAILVDSDADGFTSAAAMYNWLQENDFGSKLTYILHGDKAHGLTDEVMQIIENMDLDLLIVPDAGSNDLENAKTLKEKGIEIIVLDHHLVDTPIENGILVNCQLCENSNKNFTGVGMVYKALQLLDELNECSQNKFADDYLDLVSIGQVGDSSDVSDPEIRALVLNGLDNIKNSFVKVAFGDAVGFNTPTTKEIGFNINPIINAVTRVGTEEERTMLFEAMAEIENNRTFEVVKKKKNKTTGKFDNINMTFSLAQYAFDLAKKAKGRQDGIVKKMLPIISEDINRDLSIIIAISNNKDYPGVSGLIANKLVNKFDKPSLLLNEHEDKYTGSGRGCEKVIANFREWCERTGYFEFAKGHDNAFGVEISKDRYKEFIQYLVDNIVEADDIEYEVDVLSDRPSKEDCELVYIERNLFGGEVREPLIGLENLEVPRRFITQKGAMLTIFSWGVSIVSFSISEQLIEQIKDYPGDTLVFNIVGTYGMNNWSGSLTPQLITKDIELVYKDGLSQYNNENNDGELIF